MVALAPLIPHFCMVNVSILHAEASKYVHRTRVLVSKGFYVSFLLAWEAFHCDDTNFSPRDSGTGQGDGTSWFDGDP